MNCFNFQLIVTCSWCVQWYPIQGGTGIRKKTEMALKWWKCRHRIKTEKSRDRKYERCLYVHKSLYNSIHFYPSTVPCFISPNLLPLQFSSFTFSFLIVLRLLASYFFPCKYTVLSLTTVPLYFFSTLLLI